MAGYILAQLPDMKGSSQIVRQKENAPAIVGQSGGNSECVKVLLGLECGQSQGKIKDCAEMALKQVCFSCQIYLGVILSSFFQIQDPRNSLHNSRQFLATLIKQFYSKPYLKDMG